MVKGGGFGYEIILYSEVDACLFSLAYLILPLYVVELSVLYKMGSRLVKTKRDVFLNALTPYIENPVVIAGASHNARFAACGYLLDTFIEIGRKVEGLKKGSRDNRPVLYWKRKKYGKAEIRPVPILYGTADNYVIVALAPVGRKTAFKTVNTLGEKIEETVISLLNHSPAILPPGVGVLKEKIRGKAGKNDFTRGNFIAFVPFSLNGQVEIARFSAKAAGGVAAVHFILTIYIAVFTAGADFCAAVPRVPVVIDTLLHIFTPSFSIF